MSGHDGEGWTYPVLVGPDGRPIVVDVHDGDTVRLALDLGLEVAAFPWLRVVGLSCPELRDPAGPAAREYTARVLAAAAEIAVAVHGRSFARWLGRVVVDGSDLADVVIAAGHGQRYEER